MHHARHVADSSTASIFEGTPLRLKSAKTGKFCSLQASLQPRPAPRACERGSEEARGRQGAGGVAGRGHVGKQAVLSSRSSSKGKHRVCAFCSSLFCDSGAAAALRESGALSLFRNRWRPGDCARAGAGAGPLVRAQARARGERAGLPRATPHTARWVTGSTRAVTY